MPFIRSISGLRATLDGSLTQQVVEDYAKGFALYNKTGNVAIGKDGRPSGDWIETILAETLSKYGINVILLGMVPTPTVQMYVEHSDSIGGIVITASHNPEIWNGMKFINSDGVFLDADENDKFWNIVDQINNQPYTEIKKGSIIKDADALRNHIDSVLKLPKIDSVILEKLKKRNLKIVVDAVNSSGSEALPSLLTDLGCNVMPLFCDGTGNFPHTPEPIPENLGLLIHAVKEHKADIGIAVDPDADRLVLIDEMGSPIGEERTIVLAVNAVLRNSDKEKDKPVVVNYSTTLAVEDVANKYAVDVLRSPVGEINVVKLMKKSDAIIGGEGSGGVIYPKCHYGRDSLVAAALVLSLLADEETSLSGICSKFPDYKIVKYKKEYSGELKSLFDRIESLFSDAYIILDDGIKVNFDKSWVQLRASNTEPIVRVIAEAEDIDEADRLANEILDLI